MIGIETEYGIYVEGLGPSDLVDESTELVRACPPPFARGWDYRPEHPRRDMRGFTVDHLSIDPHDAQFENSARPHSTSIEMRADRVLPSGARLYNDHGHPEFSTPECVSLRELIAADRAGERVMQACAERRMARRGGGLLALYKNNTDFHGASYGCHESYLTSRDVSFDRLLETMLPFLVTRQIFAGAGKVGTERPGGGAGVSGVPYQLSARADFFSTIASVDTLYNRPIVNTRDEPHADARRFRRFHVIAGDANLCETSTFLKVGTTLLALRLIEGGWRSPHTLRDPISAIQKISHDQSLKWLVELAGGGGTIGAIDIQRAFLSAARDRLQGLSEDTDWVISEWDSILNRLESDPLGLADTLDWAAKRALVEEFRQSEHLEWTDSALQSIDLEYHNVDPEAGLYYGLEQEGRVRRLLTDDEIVSAISTPPGASPRAIVRGQAALRFGESIRSLSWSTIHFDSGGQTVSIRLTAMQNLDPVKIAEDLAAATSLESFVSALQRLEREGFVLGAGDADVEDDGRA